MLQKSRVFLAHGLILVKIIKEGSIYDWELWENNI